MGDSSSSNAYNQSGLGVGHLSEATLFKKNSDSYFRGQVLVLDTAVFSLHLIVLKNVYFLLFLHYCRAGYNPWDIHLKMLDPII